MNKLQRNFLVVLVIWAAWNIRATAFDDPYCGDDVCQTDPCPPGGPPDPGDGCLEDEYGCDYDCGDAYCGDDICQNPPETELNCYQDCGWCGDGLCANLEGEDPDTCSADCGYCGDAKCTYWERPFESEFYCEDDCGPYPNPGCGECTAGAGGGCGEGYNCNTDNCCVVATCSYNPCTIAQQCCSGYKCYRQWGAFTGSGSCIPPH